MMTTCGICGKRFVVTWPQHWVYRRKDVFLCGEDCMIVYDTQQTRAANGFGTKKTEGVEEDMALTQKQREEVVEIAIQGGDPIAYLKKECGAPNPWATWSYIKKKLAKDDPVKHNEILQAETLKHAGIDPKCKLPKSFQDIREVKLEQTAEVTTVAEVPPVEALEAEAAEVFKITGVETLLGSYARGQVARNVIYFRREIAEGDVIEVAMTENDWRKLAMELPKVLKTLGVEA